MKAVRNLKQLAFESILISDFSDFPILGLGLIKQSHEGHVWVELVERVGG